MGNYKVVNKHVDNTKLPRMEPEPNYEVKTRPPITEGNSWKVNLNLRIREEELSDEAMPLARYFWSYKDANVTSQWCNSQTAVSTRGSSGTYSTARRSSTTWRCACSTSTMWRWTGDDGTSSETPSPGGDSTLMRMARWADRPSSRMNSTEL